MIRKLVFILGAALVVWAVVRTLEERYRYLDLDLEEEGETGGPDWH